MIGKTISVVNTQKHLITLQYKVDSGDQRSLKKFKCMPGEITEIPAEDFDQLVKNSAVKNMLDAKSLVVGKTIAEAEVEAELPEGFVPDDSEEEKPKRRRKGRDAAE